MEPKLRTESKANREKKDVKLIMRYLEKKVRGEPLPPNVDIPEVNLYGDTEPSELFDRARSSPGKPIFVFTKLTNKTAKRMLRSCGSGKWDGRTAGMDVNPDDDVVLGEKKIFTFVPSRSSDGDSDQKKGYLSMSEYSLPKDKAAGSSCRYVICKIVYKAGSNKKRGRKPAMTTTEEEEQPLVIEKRKRSDQRVDEEDDPDYDEWMFKRMEKLSTKLHESMMESPALWFMEEEAGTKDEKTLREEWNSASPYARQMSLLLLGCNFN